MSITESPKPTTTKVVAEMATAVRFWAERNGMSFDEAVHELIGWHFDPGTELTHPDGLRPQGRR